MPFLAPALAFMAAVFFAPLAYICFLSVVGDQGFTLEYYSDLASRSLYYRVFKNTIDISISATLCTLLIGYPIAYHLCKCSPRTRILFAIIVLLPFWTSILVKSFAFTVVLGHAGTVNTLLGLLGLGPVAMLFNRIGVMIGLTQFLLPFMVFAILPSLLAQPRELRSIAEIMGAGSWRIFWRVTFPLSMPGAMAGVLVCFTLSLGMFVTPALLGGPADIMISNLIESYVNESLNWNLASVLAIMLTLLAGLFTLMIGRVRGNDPFGRH